MATFNRKSCPITDKDRVLVESLPDEARPEDQGRSRGRAGRRSEGCLRAELEQLTMDARGGPSRVSIRRKAISHPRAFPWIICRGIATSAIWNTM
jgi:hypothetical protein